MVYAIVRDATSQRGVDSCKKSEGADGPKVNSQLKMDDLWGAEARPIRVCRLLLKFSEMYLLNHMAASSVSCFTRGFAMPDGGAATEAQAAR